MKRPITIFSTSLSIFMFCSFFYHQQVHCATPPGDKEKEVKVIKGPYPCDEKGQERKKEDKGANYTCTDYTEDGTTVKVIKKNDGKAEWIRIERKHGDKPYVITYAPDSKGNWKPININGQPVAVSKSPDGHTQIATTDKDGFIIGGSIIWGIDKDGGLTVGINKGKPEDIGGTTVNDMDRWKWMILDFPGLIDKLKKKFPKALEIGFVSPYQLKLSGQAKKVAAPETVGMTRAIQAATPELVATASHLIGLFEHGGPISFATGCSVEGQDYTCERLLENLNTFLAQGCKLSLGQSFRVDTREPAGGMESFRKDTIKILGEQKLDCLTYKLARLWDGEIICREEKTGCVVDSIDLPFHFDPEGRLIVKSKSIFGVTVAGNIAVIDPKTGPAPAGPARPSAGPTPPPHPESQPDEPSRPPR